MDDLQRRMADDTTRAAAQQQDEERAVRQAEAQRAVDALGTGGRSTSGAVGPDRVTCERAHVVELPDAFDDALTLAIHVSAQRVWFASTPDGWENRLYVRVADRITSEQPPCWVTEQWPLFLTEGAEQRLMLRISQPLGRLVSVHLISRCATRGSSSWEGLNRYEPERAEISGLRISWIARRYGTASAAG